MMSLCECGASLPDDAATCLACGRPCVAPGVVPVAESAVAARLVGESSNTWESLASQSASGDDPFAFRADDVGVPRRPLFQLASPLAIAVGGLLGGPLGGCAILAHNFFKLKQRGWGLTMLSLGVAAMVLSVVAIVSFLIVHPGWTVARDLLLVVAAQMVLGAIVSVLLTQLVQRRALAYHRNESGTFLGPRGVIGQSLVCGVLVFVLQAIFSYPFFVREHVIDLGDNQRLLVGRNVSKDQAQRLAERLRDHPFFQFNAGQRVDVRVVRTNAGHEIHFFLEPAALRNPLIVATFREMRNDLAAVPFNDLPLVVILFSPRGSITITEQGAQGP